MWPFGGWGPDFRFRSGYGRTRDSETSGGAILLAETVVPGGELNSLRRPFQGRALPVSYSGTEVAKGLHGRPSLNARGVLEVGGWKIRCHSEGGICPRNLLFSRGAVKQIPRFARDDSRNGLARGICSFSRATRQSRSLGRRGDLGMTVGVILADES
jgi:hypothetical protein